jgi:DNA-binding NarL/FixJ family response regulator
MGKPKKPGRWDEVERAEEAWQPAQRAVDSAQAARVETARAAHAAAQRFLRMHREGTDPAAVTEASREAEALDTLSKAARARLDEAVEAWLAGQREALLAKARAFNAARQAQEKGADACRRADAAKRARIAELSRAGEPVKCIASAVGLSKGTVDNVIKKLREEGTLPPSRRRRSR